MSIILQTCGASYSQSDRGLVVWLTLLDFWEAKIEKVGNSNVVLFFFPSFFFDCFVSYCCFFLFPCLYLIIIIISIKGL